MDWTSSKGLLGDKPPCDCKAIHRLNRSKGRVHAMLRRIFSTVARYSASASLARHSGPICRALQPSRMIVALHMNAASDPRIHAPMHLYSIAELLKSLPVSFAESSLLIRSFQSVVYPFVVFLILPSIPFVPLLPFHSIVPSGPFLPLSGPFHSIPFHPCPFVFAHDLTSSAYFHPRNRPGFCLILAIVYFRKT